MDSSQNDAGNHRPGREWCGRQVLLARRCGIGHAVAHRPASRGARNFGTHHNRPGAVEALGASLPEAGEPVRIAGRLGVPASTVHAVLVRYRINRLSRIDRVTGKPLRRYGELPSLICSANA